MRKNLTKIFFFFVFTAVLLHSENLTNKYKQIMSAPPVQTNSETNSSKPIEVPQTSTDTNHNLINEIKKIEALKQDTFESTGEFNNRRDEAITELQNKIKFFEQKASKEYSAGTAKMKSYDADRERMQLTLNWNDDLKSIFSEIKNLQTVSLNIVRTEAKALFKQQDTHQFHIDIAYRSNKLIISKMTIYGKYNMYKPMEKHTPIKTNTENAVTKLEQPRQEKADREKATMQAELERLRAEKAQREQVQQKQNNMRIGIVYGLDPNGDGFLSIRRKPKSTEIGRLYNGSKVELLGKRGKWHKVRDLRTGTVGWSHGKWISVQ